MDKEVKRPLKAYKNLDFLASQEARAIRLLCEYYEPMSRFYKAGITDTIVFFGSSQAPCGERLRAMLAREDLEEGQRTAMEKFAKYRQEAVELSRMLTEWAMSLNEHQRFVICTGGGPGIMEAANEGAARAGGKTIGLNISIPSEQTPNPYLTEELSFEFHYFFMRKFWFAYLAKALIIFPGGFGTLDELFEVLTLVQTHKFEKKMAIIIYGTEYWSQVINLEKMVEWGTIKKSDLDLFRFSDSPQDAFKRITAFLEMHYLHDNNASRPLFHNTLKY